MPNSTIVLDVLTRGLDLEAGRRTADELMRYCLLPLGPASMQPFSPAQPISRIGSRFCHGRGVAGRHASVVAVVWLLLSAANYRSVLADLIHQWQSNPSYSHGSLVLPVCGWLLWTRRKARPALSRPWLPGLALVATSLVLLTLGEVFFLPGLQRWTLPVWLAGFVGVVFGRGMLRWSLPAVLFTCFMIPLPFQAEQLANHALQSASASISCCLLGVLGIFAVTDGHSLILPADRIEITNACSGLRMTMSLAALSFLLAAVGRSGWPQRVAVLAFAVPMALAANAMRITGFAYAVHHWSVSHVSGWAHDAGDLLMIPLAAALLTTAVAWARSCCRCWHSVITQNGITLAFGDRSASHRQRNRGRTAAGLPVPPVDETLTVREGARLPVVSARFAMGCSPLVVLIAVLAGVQHYVIQQTAQRAALLRSAAAHEAQENWGAAVECYERHLRFAPNDFAARRDRAVAIERLALTRGERSEALRRYEMLLREFPYDAKLLKHHLFLALSLGAAGPSLSSAERLRALNLRDLSARQGIAEARLRFAPSATGDGTVDGEALGRLLAETQKTSCCRDEFLVATALYCCRVPTGNSAALRRVLDEQLPQAARRLDCAEGYYACWRYGRLFNLDWANDGNLRLALQRSVAGRPLELFLAAAREARARQDFEVALELLQQAGGDSAADAAVLCELGDLHRARGQLQRAAQAFADALQAGRRDDSLLRFKLADTLAELQRDEPAVRLLRELEERLGRVAPVTPAHSRLRDDVLLLRAQVEMRLGRFEDALAALQRVQTSFSAGDDAVAESRAHRRVHRLRARCLVSMGRYHEAATLLERMARTSDTPEELLIAAGRSWRAAGDTVRASSCYCRAVNCSGARGDGWLEYIELLLASGQTATATSEVRWREQRLRTRDPAGHALVAQGWELVGQAERAEPHYRAAAEQDPQQLAALAIHLARRGQTDEAIRLIADQPAVLSPATRAHTMAVVGLVATSIRREAEQTLEEIIHDGLAQAGEDSQMLVAVANWYAARGESGRAGQLLDRAVELNPENLVAANNRAMVLAEDLQQCPEALTAIDSVVQRAGPAVEFLDTRGWILLRMNRPREAAEQLEQAISRQSVSDPVPHFHLAAAYVGIGDERRARDQWRQAQQLHLNPDTLNNSERRVFESLQRMLVHDQSEPPR